MARILNGAILGMSQPEIRRKFDEIVAFSEMEEFLDPPVKRYSTGMYARLGFAGAAHVEPDVLIVDEVLSVGDYMFQGKCMKRMKAVVAGGTTVIFVSHGLRAMSDLCQKVGLIGARQDVDQQVQRRRQTFGAAHDVRYWALRALSIGVWPSKV